MSVIADNPLSGMLVIKYEKTGTAKYIPHLDTLRHIHRIIRRAGIETEYSEGFNPHMLIFMSSPIPLGLASKCEYFSVRCKCGKQEFVEKFNAVTIDGLRITGAASASRDPKLGGIITEAAYDITCDAFEDNKDKILSLLNPEFEMRYRSKGIEIVKPVGDKIKFVGFTDNTLNLRAACGQNNLRPDRLMQSILSVLKLDSELDILKKKVYTNVGETAVPLDVVLNIENFK